MGLVHYIERQQRWSEDTFGPGRRTGGILAHIRKELTEIERDPLDLEEWIDVIILALDGAWRAGHRPQEIAKALSMKQEKNFSRTWPDWRTLTEDDPVEHIR